MPLVSSRHSSNSQLPAELASVLSVSQLEPAVHLVNQPNRAVASVLPELASAKRNSQAHLASLLRPLAALAVQRLRLVVLAPRLAHRHSASPLKVVLALRLARLVNLNPHPVSAPLAVGPPLPARALEHLANKISNNNNNPNRRVHLGNLRHLLLVVSERLVSWVYPCTSCYAPLTSSRVIRK